MGAASPLIRRPARLTQLGPSLQPRAEKAFLAVAPKAASAPARTDKVLTKLSNEDLVPLGFHSKEIEFFLESSKAIDHFSS